MIALEAKDLKKEKRLIPELSRSFSVRRKDTLGPFI